MLYVLRRVTKRGRAHQRAAAGCNRAAGRGRCGAVPRCWSWAAGAAAAPAAAAHTARPWPGGTGPAPAWTTRGRPPAGPRRPAARHTRISRLTTRTISRRRRRSHTVEVSLLPSIKKVATDIGNIFCVHGFQKVIPNRQ